VLTAAVYPFVCTPHAEEGRRGQRRPHSTKLRNQTQSLQGELQPEYCVNDALPLCACPQPPFALVLTSLLVAALMLARVLWASDSELQRCWCTMPCEAKATVARKTRARADFICEMNGLSNGQVAAVGGRWTTISGLIPSAYICLSWAGIGGFFFLVTMMQDYD
jgi:hypothetical protein